MAAVCRSRPISARLTTSAMKTCARRPAIEPLVIGERRVGRLTATDDTDRYRFTVSGPEHLRLLLEQPPGRGRITIEYYSPADFERILDQVRGPDERGGVGIRRAARGLGEAGGDAGADAHGSIA